MSYYWYQLTWYYSVSLWTWAAAVTLLWSCALMCAPAPGTLKLWVRLYSFIHTFINNQYNYTDLCFVTHWSYYCIADVWEDGENKMFRPEITRVSTGNPCWNPGLCVWGWEYNKHGGSLQERPESASPPEEAQVLWCLQPDAPDVLSACCCEHHLLLLWCPGDCLFV